MLISLARRIEGGKVLASQINNACVKGKIIILTEGSADFGLAVLYGDFLNL